MPPARPPRSAVGALLVALSCPTLAAPRDDAPLGVSTPGPIRGLFLDVPLEDARPPASPALDVRYTLANDWSKPTLLLRGGRVVQVQQDAQVDTVQLSLTVPWRRFSDAPLARRVSTTVEAHVSEVWGGWTDRPIERWHSLIGSWNFERQLYPRNEVNLRLGELGGRTIASVRSDRFVVGDVALRTQVALLGAGAPERDDAPASRRAPRGALAIRVDLKLPTGAPSRLGGSGGPDLGLGLAATARFRWLTVHGLASGRVVSDLPGGFPLRPRRFQGGLDVSLVATVRSGLALILEDRISTPLVEAGWHLPDGQREPESTAYYALMRPHNQVSGGVRTGDWTVFFSEDFTPGPRLSSDPGPRWFYDSNAPDVVIGVAWTRGL